MGNRVLTASCSSSVGSQLGPAGGGGYQQLVTLSGRKWRALGVTEKVNSENRGVNISESSRRAIQRISGSVNSSPIMPELPFLIPPWRRRDRLRWVLRQEWDSYARDMETGARTTRDTPRRQNLGMR